MQSGNDPISATPNPASATESDVAGQPDLLLRGQVGIAILGVSVGDEMDPIGTYRHVRVGWIDDRAHAHHEVTFGSANVRADITRAGAWIGLQGFSSVICSSDVDNFDWALTDRGEPPLLGEEFADVSP